MKITVGGYSVDIGEVETPEKINNFITHKNLRWEILDEYGRMDKKQWRNHQINSILGEPDNLSLHTRLSGSGGGNSGYGSSVSFTLRLDKQELRVTGDTEVDGYTRDVFLVVKVTTMDEAYDFIHNIKESMSLEYLPLYDAHWKR
jgi:hypothetical protein